MAATLDKYRKQLRDLVNEYYQQGPGYAQEGVVLREARRRLSLQGVLEEQVLLDCWHDMFRDGELEWGYNIDNPGPPFFHIRHPQSKDFVP